LKPLVTHRLPLGRAVEAIRLLTDRKAHGKVVVVPPLSAREGEERPRAPMST
jgi:hypothetical protein